jgi:hypothetical protein
MKNKANPVPSAVSRLCCIAALIVFICHTPKAVGVAPSWTGWPASEIPQFPTLKADGLTPVRLTLGQNGQQVAVRLPSGILVTEVSWGVSQETALDVLRGYVEYSPEVDQSRSCTNIRFIQVAKTTQGGGVDYDWPGLEENRNLLRTSGQMGAGIKSGYFVDHKASSCSPGMPCSPYFRDHWANQRESEDGFQIGERSAAASLVDYPFGWETLEEISLESCARCAETGKFLGCAEWGARWPTQGRRSIVPIRVRATPSKTFLAALRRFEEFYSHSELSQSSRRPNAR